MKTDRHETNFKATFPPVAYYLLGKKFSLKILFLCAFTLDYVMSGVAIEVIIFLGEAS